MKREPPELMQPESRFEPARSVVTSFTFTPETMGALRWFAANEPASWFDKPAPGHKMRSRLEKRGLIENIGKFGKPIYRLTPFARDNLAEGG